MLIENEGELKKYEELLRQYWTRGGPVWDGMAVVEGEGGNKGLILVEAKAHINETYSQMKFSSGKSKSLIKRTIQETQIAFDSTSIIDPWVNQYYQLANRLSFLYILNEKLNIPTWLVLCNFVDDRSYKPTQLKEWLQHYKIVFRKLGIDPNRILMNKVISIYVQGINSN